MRAKAPQADPEPGVRAAAAEQLTIEQLANETGMTVRNIRNHQSRGLLPPPDVRSRIGYYGSEHVARLRLIQEMQAEGFNLNAIKNLLGRDSTGGEWLLGLKRAVTAPFEEEPPEIMTADELAERFGAVDPKALAQAQKLELVVPLGDGRFEAPSPALLRAAEEVMSHGVSLASALSVAAQIKRHCEAVSRAFVKLFLEEVLKPFEEEGTPAERWPDVMESIERLRPLASEAVLAVFQQTMSAQVQDAFGKELERRAKRGR
jgi:DNA-binding transcriptional MerR regulator